MVLWCSLGQQAVFSMVLSTLVCGLITDMTPVFTINSHRLLVFLFWPFSQNIPFLRVSGALEALPICNDALYKPTFYITLHWKKMCCRFLL